MIALRAAGKSPDLTAPIIVAELLPKRPVKLPTPALIGVAKADKAELNKLLHIALFIIDGTLGL